MPVLNLGVLDQPYSNSKSGQTTGSVADILESKYGVVAYFYRTHKDIIADHLESAVQGAMESLMMGAPSQLNAFGTANQKIEDAFRAMLRDRAMDGHIDGVPTGASLAGVSKRFKQKRKKARGPRPSFVDTGLYSSSFRSWVE